MRIRSRLKHWWAMFGPVGKVVAMLYAFYGAFATVVTFLPKESRENLEGSALLKWLPAWSIWEWTALTLAVILLAILENSWHRHGRGAPAPELALGSKGSLFHQLWVTNVGPPATFRAQLRIIETNAGFRHAVGPQGPLRWETEQSINVRLPTGGSDWILLARCDLFTLFRYDATAQSTLVLLEGGSASDKSPPFAAFDVTVISDPPVEEGPRTRRYHYDRNGLRAVPLTALTIPTEPTTFSVAHQELSFEEKNQIQNIRYAWKEFGTYAANGLDSLLDKVLDNYARQNRIGSFLYHAQHQLRRTRDKVEAAVANDSVQSLDHVQAHLNNYTEAYIYAYGLVEVIHENGMPVSGDAYRKILEVWQGLHATWREELVKLYHRPEHGDQLKTFRDVRPPGFLPPTTAVGALSVNAIGTVTPPPSQEEPSRPSTE